MKLETFALERLQSTWENRVAWNLSESGVQPLRLMELADTEALRDAVLAQELGYPQTNGTAALRTAIAALYDGATPDHVQVTNGGSDLELPDSVTPCTVADIEFAGVDLVAFAVPLRVLPPTFRAVSELL